MKYPVSFWPCLKVLARHYLLTSDKEEHKQLLLLKLSKGLHMFLITELQNLPTTASILKILEYMGFIDSYLHSTCSVSF